MKSTLLITAAALILATHAVAAEPASSPAVAIPAKENVHLYLLLGQSNMAGRGTLPAEKAAGNPRILVLNKNNEWAVAADPLHHDKSSAGVSPGMSFAQTMLKDEKDPAVVIGLIPCAVGGSKLESWQKDGDLFKQAVERARIASQKGTLKGVLWHQGETDSQDAALASTYGARLAQMVGDLRAALGAGEIPFVAGKLAEGFDTHPHGKLVNGAIEELPKKVARTACADSKGLGNNGDGIHFSAEGQIEFGKRYAEQMLKFAGSTAPLQVADRTCLFLDDHFIAEQKGLTRTFHQGKPSAKAVINETEPWEHWICLWGACFYDPEAKVYRMYYQSTLYPSNEPGISFRDYICYAESKDGVTWEKPKLGLVEHDGSKDNNVVFPFAGPANVFLDPKATDPKGRIKANIYFLKADPKYKDARGMALLQSADGVNWEYVTFMDAPTFANPDDGGFVDIMLVGWDPLKQKYIGQYRCFSQHKVAEKPTGKRRALGITWSDKPHRDWSPVIQTLKPDDRDDEHTARLGKDPAKPDFAEFYTMPHMVYGNHYLGFITLFELADARDGNGGGGVHFAFSNDGLKWTRPEPRRNVIENSDDPELFPTFVQFTAPLQMGDETWLYYSETNGTHGSEKGFPHSRGRIRAAVWRKDGFASLESAAGTGTLITKPLAHDGKELLVNFETEEGGTVRVGILDESGVPITQFNLGECQPLKGNATAHKVVWSGGTDFSKLAPTGKPVRLMFELNKAKLWSFRFAK